MALPLQFMPITAAGTHLDDTHGCSALGCARAHRAQCRSDNTLMGLLALQFKVQMAWNTAVRKSARVNSATENMSDKQPKESGSRFATRIDPAKEGLSKEQMHFIRQVELEQWKKKTPKLRARNIATGLAIGAIVVGICILGEHAR